MYPTLQYLEEQGMVRAREENDRRVYHIAETGKTELAARTDDIQAFWSRFATPVIAESSRHAVDFLHEALDDLNRTVWRGLRGAIETGDENALRLVRETIEQCRSDIRIIISDAAKIKPAPKSTRVK